MKIGTKIKYRIIPIRVSAAMAMYISSFLKALIRIKISTALIIIYSTVVGDPSYSINGRPVSIIKLRFKGATPVYRSPPK